MPCFQQEIVYNTGIWALSRLRCRSIQRTFRNWCRTDVFVNLFMSWRLEPAVQKAHALMSLKGGKSLYVDLRVLRQPRLWNGLVIVWCLCLLIYILWSMLVKKERSRWMYIANVFCAWDENRHRSEVAVRCPANGKKRNSLIIALPKTVASQWFWNGVSFKNEHMVCVLGPALKKYSLSVCTGK